MSFFSALGGLAGGLVGALTAGSGIKDIKKMAEFNPWQGTIGGLGSFGPGGFSQNPMFAGLQNQLAGAIPGYLQGGLSGLLSNAWATGDMNGAMTQANQALQQQANPFYNQANFANNMANISGLGNMFAGNVAQGPQDMTGGNMANLFGQGQANLAQAGNLGGLVSQYNQQLNDLAAPGEQRAFNRFMDNEFQLTGGATTGAGQRGGEFMQAQMQAANQRGLMAQQFGQSEAQRLGQLGLGQMAQGAGLLGQNLGFFGDQAQRAAQFGQLGMAGEAQGFDQLLRALQANQAGGSQRLQNMLSLFGAQADAYQGAGALGIQGLGAYGDLSRIGLEGQLGLLNAEASRITGTGYHSQALSGLRQQQGGFLSGLF